MFSNNVVKPTQQDRAQETAKVITDVGPDLMGICEAANEKAEHEHFSNTYLPGSNYKVALGASRGAQNLVFYHKNLFKPVSIDADIAFYEPWDEDVDKDKLKEHHKWDRKPLEAVFEIGNAGPRIMFVLVHPKSKGVFDVVDVHDFEDISQANRTRLIGQALKLRERIDNLMKPADPLPTVVLGDMNDGPGLDFYERNLGTSFVETVMGSVFDPQTVFRNSLYWMTETTVMRKELYTVEFPGSNREPTRGPETPHLARPDPGLSGHAEGK